MCRDRVRNVYGLWYITGNYVDGYPSVTSNNWNGGVDPQGGTGEQSMCKSTTAFPAATTYPVTEQTAITAYSYVLNTAPAAAWYVTRLTRRIIRRGHKPHASLRRSYGTIPWHHRTTRTQWVGGPRLNSTLRRRDTDHDGMPDAWESPARP